MPVPRIYVVPGTESVNDLVKRIADRDQAAFRRFHRRLVRAVFAQVCESLGSPALAVAVTRAVFVEVWRLAPMPASRQLDGTAWVTAIAARRAADRLREINGPTPASAPPTTISSVANSPSRWEPNRRHSSELSSAHRPTE